MLSAEDLVRQNVSLQKAGAPNLSRGLKNVFPTTDNEEFRNIDKLRGDLFDMLNRERIERRSVRSQADYVPNGGNAYIRVTRKMGKWNLFGYTRENELCIHSHEALYLIEMNKLELHFNSIACSLEQAYAILLDSSVISSECYFVYSHLMRASYVVQLYSDSVQPIQTPAANASTVWKCLALLLSKSANPLDSDNTDVRHTAASMQTIADHIRNARSPDDTHETADMGQWNPMCKPNLKRTYSEADLETNGNMDRLLDIHLDDPSEIVNEFRAVFQKLQIVRLTEDDCDGEYVADDRMFPIVFDLFAANADYRKSNPGKPNYRVIVAGGGQRVPSRRVIYRRYMAQSCKVPILVVFANEAMNMQAYCYMM